MFLGGWGGLSVEHLKWNADGGSREASQLFPSPKPGDLIVVVCRSSGSGEESEKEEIHVAILFIAKRCFGGDLHNEQGKT